MQSSKPFYIYLSRRESQFLDILYRLGKANASDVLKELPDPPGYSTVRRILTILESKGYIVHKKREKRFIYSPKFPEMTKRLAIEHLVSIFFNDSGPKAVSALLNRLASSLSERELEELSKIIDRAKLNKKKKFHYKIQAIT